MILSAAGIRATILAGPVLPAPAPPNLLRALVSIEIKAGEDEAETGLQLVFRAGRGPDALGDYPLMTSPQFAPGARIVVVATLGILPQPIFDGVVLNHELQPGEGQQAGKLTLTAASLAHLMNRKEASEPKPGQAPHVIALTTLARYSLYGVVPMAIPAPSLDQPIPAVRTPMQVGTDFALLTDLAKRYDYIFTITPGPVPTQSIAYWGPRKRFGFPQPALTVAMGPETNVANLAFNHDTAAPAAVEGKVQESDGDRIIPVRSVASARPPLALRPARSVENGARTIAYRAQGAKSAAQAQAEAQAMADATADALTVTGELDVGRYGQILEAGRLVGLRGAGLSYDGLYAVTQVSHRLAPGSYKQNFTLAREGLGSTVPVVRP